MIRITARFLIKSFTAETPRIEVVNNSIHDADRVESQLDY